MNDRRLMLMAGMVGAPALALIVCFFAFVPFKVSVHSIDRRTGNTTAEVLYWGLYRESFPDNPDQNRYYHNRGSFTAPIRWMPCMRSTWRFPWTSVGESEDIPPGSDYYTVFHALFTDVRMWGTDLRKIPDDERDEIIRRRIPLWNSAEVDRDPKGLIERLRKENEELHRMPTP